MQAITPRGRQVAVFKPSTHPEPTASTTMAIPEKERKRCQHATYSYMWQSTDEAGNAAGRGLPPASL